jgi:hypothetical protein
MGELGAVDGKYAKLRELYPDDSKHGSRRFPWAPPQPTYCLPKTEKEFQAEHDKAFAEFNAVLAEGKASGVLTTAPRVKKPKVELSEPAKALAAVVGDACPEDVATMVAKHNARSGYEPGDEEEEAL